MMGRQVVAGGVSGEIVFGSSQTGNSVFGDSEDRERWWVGRLE